MNEKKCCVSSCQQTRADNTILHLFPNPKKELDRFNKWIYAIGGNVLVLDPLVVFKYGRVCHSHFDPKYYTSSKRLSKIAVPSLYLSGISFNPRPALQEVTNVLKETFTSQPTPSTSQQPVASTSKDLFIQRPALQEVTNVLKETFTSQPTPSTSQQPVASTSKDLFIQRPALQEVTNVLKETSLGTVTFQPAPSTSKQPVPSISKDKKNMIKWKSFDSNTILLRNKIKKLQQHKDCLLNRLKKALKLSENAAFQKAVGKFSATANLFTNLQFREAGKHRKGCRFNNKEKVMALALYKQGPRAYRWLQKIFVLPSPLTLSRMISRAALHPGINENLFRLLEKKVRKMTTLEKLCILLFDEVALSAHFDYNRRTDRVNGFVDNGIKKQNKIADHALVFMVRGVQKNYKQPIAYTFCCSTTPAVELALQIKAVLRKLHSIGLDVIATVCDQGSTNVSAINWLIKTTKGEYLRQGKELKYDIFEVDGKEIVPLYDPPHLIKGIRNNLINKDFKFTMDGQEKTAKWDHIIKVYNENLAYKGIRLMPKLTDRHVIPQKIAKMKVKCATQVFSKTVAAYMGLLSGVGVLPKECEDTADMLIFFDNLFDSVNGSYSNYSKRRGKPLLGPVTPSSAHKTVWLEAKKVLNTMRFCKNNKSSVVPSIKHWLQTIENIEYIVKMLFNKYNLTSLWMRHFNQDPLENFFGCIRSHGYRNISPSCAGFESAFASLLINNLNSMHSPGANCENDNCNNFQSLQGLFFNTPETSSYTMEVNFDDVNSDNIFVDLEIKRSDPKIKAQLDYVTGYVLKKLKLKCKNCTTSLYEKVIRDDCAISVREFVKNKHSLTYPSITLINCFSQIQDVVICILRKDSKKDNIRQYIKTIFSVVMDYKFIQCGEHKKEIVSKIEDMCLNIFIYNWCKDTNKILCGSRKDFDAEDLTQILAFDYCKKRLK